MPRFFNPLYPDHPNYSGNSGHSRNSKEAAPKDARLHAPATARNRAPLLDILAPEMAKHLETTNQHSDKNPARPPAFLEIASGTGEHSGAFAAHFPLCHWYPSDLEHHHRESIDAWRTLTHTTPVANMHPALNIDATLLTDQARAYQNSRQLPQYLNGILAINLLHIAPWAVTQALIGDSAALFQTQKSTSKQAPFLFLYGPFTRDGQHSAASNAAFDANLQRRNPAWGVRDLNKITAIADRAGFCTPKIHAMPANNLAVFFPWQQGS